MLKRINVFLFGALFFNVVCVAAAPTLVSIKCWRTKNNVPVYFVRATQLPMLDVREIFTAGSAYDAHQWGLAELTNSMLGEATIALNANQIANGFDQVGAQLSGDVDRDRAVVSLRTLVNAHYLNPALTLYRDVVAKAQFPEKAFLRVKNNTLAGIKSNEQQPEVVAENAFYQQLYGNAPYGHSVSGTLSSVGAINKPDVENFYQAFYVARNAMVVMVGDVTVAQAHKIANEITQALLPGRPAPAFNSALTMASSKQTHIQFPAQQTSILIGALGITRDNPNYFPLIVGNYVLGGLPLNSILFNEVRNKYGLTYDISSQFVPLKNPGPFMIELQTKNAKTKQAIQVVKTELINYLKHGPTSGQLKMAKQNLIDGFALQLDSNTDLLAVLTNMAFYHRSLDYLDRYRNNVARVTAKQIQQAFQQQLNLNHLLILTVGGTH